MTNEEMVGNRQADGDQRVSFGKIEIEKCGQD